jgi:O-antigen ligase
MNMLAIQPSKNLRSRTGLSMIGMGLVVAFLAIFFGMAAAVLPWWLVMGALIAPTCLIVGLAIPEVGIAIMLILVCGVVPAGMSPSIPLGAGSVKIPELMILAFVVWSFFKLSTQPPLGQYWKWLLPVGLLLGLTITAAGISYGMFGTPRKEILAEARQYLSWLVVMPIIALIQTEKQLERFLKALVFVGCFVAFAALLQFVLGRPIVEGARVEDLVTLNKAADVSRSIVGPGNYFLIFSILFLLARMMTRSLSWAVAMPLMGWLLAGLIVNFGRGLWVATFGGALLLSFWLFRWRGVWRVAIAGSVGLVISLGVLAAYKPNIIAAAYDRLISTGGESLERNTTLGWRLEETNAALKKLAKYPITGIGIGTAYKQANPYNGMFITEHDEVLTRYIHNAYIGSWLKFGFLGPIVIVFLIVGVLKRGLRYGRSTQDVRLKALFFTTAAAFFVPVLTSVTQPEWLSQAGIAFFASMVGLQVITHRVMALRPEPDSAQAEPAKPAKPAAPIYWYPRA